MTDIVDRLRSPEVFIDMGGMTSPVAHLAADEIERLRAALRRALRLHDIEQAERPTPNQPIWVGLARQLLERER